MACGEPLCIVQPTADDTRFPCIFLALSSSHFGRISCGEWPVAATAHAEKLGLMQAVEGWHGWAWSSHVDIPGPTTSRFSASCRDHPSTRALAGCRKMAASTDTTRMLGSHSFWNPRAEVQCRKKRVLPRTLALETGLQAPRNNTEHTVMCGYRDSETGRSRRHVRRRKCLSCRSGDRHLQMRHAMWPADPDQTLPASQRVGERIVPHSPSCPWSRFRYSPHPTSARWRRDEV